jgi:hypothetical protein
MGSFSDALSILEAPSAPSANGSPDVAPPMPRSEQGSFGAALDILEGRSAPTVKETKPKIGTGEAGLEGYLSGASFNWRDEIYGASKASGLPDWLGGFRALIGAPRLAYEKATRPSPTLSDLVTGRPTKGPVEQAYDQAVAEIRERQKQAQEERPFAYGAGNLGGAVAATAALPIGKVAQGASLAERMYQGAKAGAVLGGVAGAGEGEGAGDTLVRGVLGTGTGAVGGAVAAPIASGLEKLGGVVYNAAIRPGWNIIQGLRNPDAEAARRIWTAVERDSQAGRAGLSPTEYVSLQRSGEPVAVADVGGAATQDLARSAANTSPEAHAALREMTDARYQTQNIRAAGVARNLSGGANATKTRAQLIEDYDRERVPAYIRAYQDGDRPLWDEGFEQIAQAPAVQDAIRKATITGANDAARLGFTPVRNPFAMDQATGRMVPRVDDKGNRILPNLQFWDSVKKNLDQVGDRQAQDFSRVLRDRLDELVPSYKDARGVASKFFDARDALEAGEKAVLWKGDPQIVRQQVAKMSANEQTLFREGYASALAQKMENLSDRTNVTNQIFQTPQARKMIDAVYGRGGSDRIEAFIRRENIMDAARKALGNSTTARQLIMAGMAGGAFGASQGDDLWSVLKGGAEGAAGFAGARMYGGKVIGMIDQRTARRVGEMLASDNLDVLNKGLKVVANSRLRMDALRNLDTRLAALLAARQGAVATGRLMEGHSGLPQAAGL